MKNLQRTAACILAAAMVCGLTACDESEPTVSGSQSGISAPGSESAATQASTTTDPDANAATDKEVKEIDTTAYTPDGNAGTVKILSFYDITTDQKGTEQSLIFQSDVYGGSIDWISTPSGDAYFEKGVEDDIFGTVSDFAFVPFPRDSTADTYYQAYDTYGFLVPKGSKNIKGAVDFINCFRVYDTDPEIQAQVRKDHVDPTPMYFQEGKYAGSEKWQIKWGEQEYDLWREMCDPSKFTFVMENAWGFSSDFESQYIDVLNSVTLDGESWTKQSEEFSPIVDTIIAEYSK